MRKIKVYFPLVEAGFGHIMPCNAVCDKFIEKYGNDERLEIIRDRFFGDSNDPKLFAYEKGMIDALKSFQKCHAWGYFANWWDMFFWTPKAIALFTIRLFIKPGTFKHMVQRAEAIDPDVVFSTHWSTNYAYKHAKKVPYTIMLCPDCRLDRMFAYPCDLRLISSDEGYKRAMGKWGNTPDNFKKVPFCLRKEAYEVDKDKLKQREKLGLPKDKFTVVIMEGGYGNGRLKKICQKLLEADVPMTIVPICGKNPELHEYLKTLKPGKNVTFVPFGFCPNGVEYIGAADLFLGKSGINVVNEAAFFDVPTIITDYTNYIEQFNGEHYIKYVGNAQRIHRTKKIVKAVINYAQHPELLEPFKENCKKAATNFGTEETADLIYKGIEEKFFNKK